MACSRFEYVKAFEHHHRLLPGCWAVIRLDGRSFSRFSKMHNFRKPNDERALNLANAAAKRVLLAFDNQIIFAYGESDEYSFVLKRESCLFSRRSEKILSTIVSLFTSSYVMEWSHFMQGIKLLEPPSFDGRIVLYPTTKHLRDYLSWRQADTHINNLYNTAFWALVTRGNKTSVVAEEMLKGTLSKDKHEILHSQFGINYNDENEMFKKGSIIIKNPAFEQRSVNNGEVGKRQRMQKDELDTMHEMSEGWKQTDMQQVEPVIALHADMIGEKFWNDHPDLLGPSDLNPPRLRKL